MAGTRKWQMNEILWILAQYRAGHKRTVIEEAFHKKFPRASHVVDSNSIRYAISTFKDHPEFNQHWEPLQISFVLGRRDAGVRNDDIAREVLFRWPEYVWARGVARPQCIEYVFVKYHHDPEYNRAWNDAETDYVLELHGTGVSDDTIVQLAHNKFPHALIFFNDVQYIVARYKDDYRYQRHLQKFNPALKLAPLSLDGQSCDIANSIPTPLYPSQQSLQYYTDLPIISYRCLDPRLLDSGTIHTLPDATPRNHSIEIEWANAYKSLIPNHDIGTSYEASVERGRAYQMLVGGSDCAQGSESNTHLGYSDTPIGMETPVLRDVTGEPTTESGVITPLIQPATVDDANYSSELTTPLSQAPTSLDDKLPSTSSGDPSLDVSHDDTRSVNVEARKTEQETDDSGDEAQESTCCAEHGAYECWFEKADKTDYSGVEEGEATCCVEHEAYECWVGPFFEDESSASPEAS